MITVLPIEGKPLCMSIDSKGWCQQMEALIGMSPPEPSSADGEKKERVPAGAPFTWIATNFVNCPEDADETYARVYMWYVIFRTIFADNSSKNAQWMWLKVLTVFDHKFSCGSAALAYFYRQLDEACRRSTRDDKIGGCMLLLSVWSWECLQVGRPREVTFKAWDAHNNHVRLPTRAYKWDVVSEDDILEDPTSFDELAHGEYNKLIREEYQTSFVPVLNFVRKEIKKQADETEAVLDTTRRGKKSESTLQLFIKKLRQLSNILGYHDPEYTEPSRSGSSHRNTQDDSSTSGARMDDDDITSGAHLEDDDVVSPEVEDDMT
ncbi:mutator protein [Hordeum vulgare]|nr:mutator protein [Hordeum vulgare]